MGEDIRKGELVKVIVAGPFQDQRVKVLANNGRYYRLATTYANTPYPCWFERHEIELVTPEESRGVV
jgi:hypothetical protein